METITKIIRAKDRYKTLEIPKEFVNQDIKVTFEPINNPEKNSNEEIIVKLNMLRQKTGNIKIASDLDVDDMIDEMNIDK
ncbi:MAG: hypothetical protein KDD00_10620 [Ignavibacteriae bacterium]|nr:hypothetical protein [Ignavibacteriota bacterium]